MQKIGRASAQVAGRFLFLGVSVQILLGICWGVRSFGIFPELCARTYGPYLPISLTFDHKIWYHYPVLLRTLRVF